MIQIDFANYGMQGTIDLEGDLVGDREGATPPIIIFAERHRDLGIITQNIHNACTLIDNHIVDLICSEKMTLGGRAEAEAHARKRGFQTLEAFREDSRQELPTDDDAINALSSRGTVEFPRTVLYLRPAAEVQIVEDLELWTIADRLHTQCELDCVANPNHTKEIKRRFRHDQVNRDREVKFVNNLFTKRQELNCNRATILNVGGFHALQIPALLSNDQSYIHIRPTGYPADELD
jgi:hypothetical protein